MNTGKQLSKEEILLGCVGLQPNRFPENLVFEAMDMFAKQEAIAFNKWMNISYVESGFDTDRTVYYSHVSFESEEKYTTEQLYELYIQSKPKE